MMHGQKNNKKTKCNSWRYKNP